MVLPRTIVRYCCLCRLRVTEHNLLVVSKYYARIRLGRLAELLDLPPAEAERHLSDMVVAGAVAAKIDRPAGAPCRPAIIMDCAW